MYMYRERVKFLGEKKFYLYRNECVHHAAMTSDLSFTLNHNNVVPKLCPNGRVCVAGSIHCAGLQLEGSILKWSHH